MQIESWAIVAPLERAADLSSSLSPMGSSASVVRARSKEWARRSPP